MKPIILRDEPFTLLHTRGEIYYIHPWMIILTLLNLIKTSLSPGRCYKLAFIQMVKPKVVMTYIDNDDSIGEIAPFYKEAEFYSIQSSYRGIASRKAIKFLPHYFCFGENERDLYSADNVQAQSFLPVGSIVASYFMEKFGEPAVKDYDFVIISQFRASIFIEKKSDPDDLNAWTVLLAHLKKYLEANPNLKVAVAMVSFPSEEKMEEDFFKTHLSSNVTLLPNDRAEMVSYKNIARGDIVLGVNSTLMFESFGMGFKTFFCDTIEGEDYSFRNSQEKFFHMEGKEYDEFAQKISAIREMNKEEYLEKSKRDRKYFMNIEEGSLQKIRETLLR